MSKINPLKVLGIVATVAGVGLTLLNNYLGDKNLDAKIDSKLTKALESKTKES